MECICGNKISKIRTLTASLIAISAVTLCNPVIANLAIRETLCKQCKTAMKKAGQTIEKERKQKERKKEITREKDKLKRQQRIKENREKYFYETLK